jgi:putative flippase GtrA
VIRQFFSKEFVVFLLTGGCAALVNFSSRILYSHWLSFSDSVIAAYLTGMLTAFVLVRLLVFTGSTQPLHRSALRFSLINLVAVAQTWGISMLLAYQVLPALGVARLVPEIAHAVGVAVPVFTSYLGHKHWSFAKR